MKPEYKLPEEIYINRRRQEERASYWSGVWGSVALVFVLMYVGYIVGRFAEAVL